MSVKAGQAHQPYPEWVATVRYQHVMADRDAAIARELNRLIEGA
jgi:hypothetical protein